MSEIPLKSREVLFSLIQLKEFSMATVEWTVLEKLLLSQAVYKYGEDNWFQIARNLKHHALLDRPSDYFNQKVC